MSTQGPAPRPRPILLAAGRSTRFRGGHKLLAPLRGEPVVVHALRALLEAGLDPPLVVLGGESVAVEAALQEAFPRVAFEAVVNGRYAEGLGTSLALAARLCGERPLLVALGDMPCLSAADHRAVVAALDPSDPLAVARGSEGGVAGHPVAMGRAWPALLAGLGGDRGAGALLREAAITFVPLDPATQIDVDTREALARAEASLGQR